MKVFSKIGLALICVLVPIWLLNHYTSVGVPLTADKPTIPPPEPVKVAEQQLVDALTLWRDKQYQTAKQTFSLLNAQKLTPELQALAGLYEYHASAFIKESHTDFIQQLTPLSENCRQRLLFVTPNLESLPQAEYFRSRFAQDSRLTSLSICIYTQTWFDPEDIVCEENWQQNGRLGCELLSVAEKLKKLPFTHLVMFAEKGKANVHNGIMFLDRQDTYDVFVHELAHFSGFVDEYPLNKVLAKRVCAGIDAPNMVFQQVKQATASQQYRQQPGLQTEQGLYAARTCDNHSAQAFKASNKLTFMEYHDTAFIPEQYLSAWQKQLDNRPNQPSAHVNFAQLYEQSNNQAESQFWRAKYQQYLLSSGKRPTNL